MQQKQKWRQFSNMLGVPSDRHSKASVPIRGSQLKYSFSEIIPPKQLPLVPYRLAIPFCRFLQRNQ